MSHAEAFEFWVRRPAVDPDASCWAWAGPLSKSYGGNNYGMIILRGKHVMAHRWAYEQWIGPIPDGYHVHHNCHTQECSNPSHLEAIEAHEHLRSHGRPRLEACGKGHEFTPENTYWPAKGSRQCRICQRERLRQRRATQAKVPCNVDGCDNMVYSGHCRSCHRRMTGK